MKTIKAVLIAATFVLVCGPAAAVENPMTFNRAITFGDSEKPCGCTMDRADKHPDAMMDKKECPMMKRHHRSKSEGKRSAKPAAEETDHKKAEPKH